MSEKAIIHPASWQSDEAAIRAVRTEVFVREQGISAELDFDGLDAGSMHVLALDAGGKAVGTARMQADGHVGRLAVLKKWRGRGVGTALMAALVEKAREMRLPSVYLNAQVPAAGFYEKLGFAREGEIFVEAGIPHCKMTRKLA